MVMMRGPVMFPGGSVKTGDFSKRCSREILYFRGGGVGVNDVGVGPLYVCDPSTAHKQTASRRALGRYLFIVFLNNGIMVRGEPFEYGAMYSKARLHCECMHV